MAVEGSLGTTFHISAGIPATEDQAGYEALTFTKVGEITTLGEIGGVWNNATATLLETGTIIKRKSSRDNGDLSMQMLKDTTDAGQIIMRAAEDSRDPYSIKAVEPDGTSHYSQALVNSYRVATNTAEDMKFANADVAVTADWVEVAAP